MAIIQVRAPDRRKKSVQRILKNMGLDLSTAINMYLVQIELHEGIPFSIRTENGFTPEKEEQLLKEVEWVKKNGKGYSSAEELHKAILAE